MLPVITFARRLPQHWLAFIDNVAAQFALMKGYGRDPASTAFWLPSGAWPPIGRGARNSRGFPPSPTSRTPYPGETHARREGWHRVRAPADEVTWWSSAGQRSTLTAPAMWHLSGS